MVKVDRVLSYDFYVLRAVKEKTIEEIPYLVSFQKSSLGAAKRLLTAFQKMSRLGKSSSERVVQIHTEKQENEKGSWYSLTWKMGREATAEELEAAKFWYQDIQSGAKDYKVHEPEEAVATQNWQDVAAKAHAEDTKISDDIF